jgi:AAA domain
MPQLTKAEIERKLLWGTAITWVDGGAKNASMALPTPAQRRLFEYLLASDVREPTGLRDSFITGLQAAFDADTDPAADATAPATQSGQSASWRLHAIESEGFGGLNIWKGKTFRYEFEADSHLLEGPNGSGKSSLVGAIIWALTGERPRDQAPAAPHLARSVFGNAEQSLGEWPPIATYPPSPGDLKSTPTVRVTLTFVDDAGNQAKIERRLKGTQVDEDWDPKLVLPSVLLEAGLLMPARLSTLKLNENKGDLTEAVQKLTGLDDLVAMGQICDGLCHATREYRAFKKREHKLAVDNFERALKQVRTALEPVSVQVDTFVPANTNETDGAMAKFGQVLSAKAQELTSVVASDLSSSLDLSKTQNQTSVVTAIATAQDDVTAGLAAFPTWKIVTKISSALDKKACADIQAAIDRARNATQEAWTIRRRGTEDSRFQLKALAARWHAAHASGSVDDCPLCLRTLSDDPALAKEIEALKQSGEAASRTYSDNINRITAALTQSVPEPLRAYSVATLAFDPQAAIPADAKAIFCNSQRYSAILVSLVERINGSLESTPTDGASYEAPSATPPETDEQVESKIAVLKRLLSLSAWHSANAFRWETWWTELVHGAATDCKLDSGEALTEAAEGKVKENLSTHLKRLSDALQKAGPYRDAAKALREAWKEGQQAVQLQQVIDKREAIATALQPLKSLGSLCESIARETIQQLSARIGAILKGIHLTETLKYREARLLRKEGLVVRAGFGPDLRLDATLVANTSWLRAVLWAFILALREEAVQQLGYDSLPLLVLDDPQATFDYTHRHLWAMHVAGMQNGPGKTQVILASYDEAFLYHIKISGVAGREALIVSSGDEFEHVAIIEGSVLDREWNRAEKLNSPQGGRAYMSAARVYIEGMLKLMLRDEITKPQTYALGSCRTHIERLQSKGGISPWNRPDMVELVRKLDGTKLSQIKHIEIAHHADGLHLGMGEAAAARSHLSKLLPLLETCFRIIRATRALHGGQKALHKASPLVTLPEGYKSAVKNLALQVWGRAAALTDGKAADGVVDLDEYAGPHIKKITLAQHEAYVLNAPTLEPVARPGDILLVHDADDPPVNSLVCAIDHDRIVARRFALAAHDGDVAVLSAQTINPFELAAPVVAQRATLQLRGIAGVLYRPAATDQGLPSVFEIAECEGEAAITSFAADTLGLVEVVGRSAEPYALDGQYLLVRKAKSDESLHVLEGRPVIAGDSDGHRYFKRLRLTKDRVVLESLDVGGDHGPVVLALPGATGNSLASIWAVVGVLFELPGKKAQH